MNSWILTLFIYIFNIYHIQSICWVLKSNCRLVLSACQVECWFVHIIIHFSIPLLILFFIFFLLLLYLIFLFNWNIDCIHIKRQISFKLNIVDIHRRSSVCIILLSWLENTLTKLVEFIQLLFKINIICK